MNRFVSHICLLLFCHTLFAQNVDFEWVVQGGSARKWSDRGGQVAIDTNDNIYLVGVCSEHSTFNDTTLKGGNFLCKYNGVGDLVWGRTVINDFENPRLCSSKDNDIFLFGRFGNWHDTTMIVGGIPLTPVGDKDLYLCKYDENGDAAWAINFGSVEDDFHADIAVDNDNHVYVTGSFGGTPIIEDSLYTSFNPYDNFIAKFDNSGNLQWISRIASGGSVQTSGIAIDGNQNIFLLGSTKGTALFDTISHSAIGFNDIYLAKYTQYGRALWVEGFGSQSVDYSGPICIDWKGDIYMAGNFRDTAMFGSTILISQGQRDAFVAKCNSNGDVLWAKAIGGVEWDQASAIHASDKLYLSCSMEGNFLYNGSSFTTFGEVDIFILAIDFFGSDIWSKHFGGTSQDFSMSIRTDGNRNVYVGGYFYGTMFLDDDSITAFGNHGYGDVFLTQISQPTIINPLGSYLNNNSHNRPIVYPNPSTGVIFFDLAEEPSSLTSSISLYNLLGQEIQINSPYNGNKIDISNLESGVYLIEITTVGKKYLYQILKQ